MKLRIEGHDLPGLSCEWNELGQPRTNVHVGLQLGRDPHRIKPADRRKVQWTTDIEIVHDQDGNVDFRGKAVQGKRGERFVYLTWGEPLADGFDMFRRAKLMLHRVDETLIERWRSDGGTLVASVHLTDDFGQPRCARVDPPAIEWWIAD